MQVKKPQRYKKTTTATTKKKRKVHEAEERKKANGKAKEAKFEKFSGFKWM